MDRISINLLPIDLKENKKLLYKKKLVNLISAGILTILVMATGILVILSVVQNRQMNEAETELSQLNNTLASLKEKEAAVIILKKRLTSISQVIRHKYPQTDSFLLVTSLLPENVTLQNFVSEQTNSVTLQGTAVNAASLQQFFDNLTDPKINEGKITKTVITNLNRGNSPQLNFDLEVSVKIEGGNK
jgi:Tfp pilus assembly protein PilN